MTRRKGKIASYPVFVVFQLRLDVLVQIISLRFCPGGRRTRKFDAEATGR